MEEKIKAIISRFTKIPIEQIIASTVIDRTAVTGSILLHRMYAALATEGIVVENYWDIKNYGALLQRVNGPVTHSAIQILPQEATDENAYSTINDSSFKGIGIDIEKIEAMPVANDYREEEFYKMNFTSAEIAYCILQPDARASFAGLFAAKEAMVKANNTYKNKPFNTIFIDHLPDGKPVHHQFQLSISHTSELAIAMATYSDSRLIPLNSSLAPETKPYSKPGLPLNFWIAFLAFLISITALILSLSKH